MLPSSTAPTLAVLSPTATTVSFIVSTRTPRTTVPAHVAHALGLLLRLLLALTICGIWWIKWSGSAPEIEYGSYVWIHWTLIRVRELVEGGRGRNGLAV